MCVLDAVTRGAWRPKEEVRGSCQRWLRGSLDQLCSHEL